MRFMVLIGFLFITNLLFAQNNGNEPEMQTLFGNQSLSFGGFGGPSISFSSFNGKDALLVGGTGAAIVNHSFFFGGGGYGIVNSPFFAQVHNNQGAYAEGGYGGFMLGFVLCPRKLVHLSVPVLIGGGSLLYSDNPIGEFHHDGDIRFIDRTNFFVIEPGVNVELNVLRFLRIAAGVKYRYTPGLKLMDTPSDAFNTISGSVSILFGLF